MNTCVKEDAPTIKVGLLQCNGGSLRGQNIALKFCQSYEPVECFDGDSCISFQRGTTSRCTSMSCNFVSYQSSAARSAATGTGLTATLVQVPQVRALDYGIILKV